MGHLPEHLGISCQGNLYDTRKGFRDFRFGYAKHYRDIQTACQFVASLRAGAYAWPGGYPIVYYTSDGGVLCSKCARSEARNIIDSIHRGISDGWRVVGCEAYETDTDQVCCDHCGDEL